MTATTADKPRRILLIENDVASMELMFHLLSSYGYAPLRARNGEEGLKLAARERPELIVCVIEMPFVDGYEVARRVRTDPQLNHIPLLAITGFANPEDRSKVLAAGYESYVSKPISPESFVRHIESFLHSEFRTSALPPRSTAGDATLPPRSRRRVLVVDDTPANLKLAATLLASAGYRVTTAENTAEALRLARNDPPDLILSDIVMFDGSGYEFIRAVKADPQLRSIPFVFNTASMAMQAARDKGLALGAVKVLFRPIDAQTMLKEIEACFDAA